MMKSLRKLLFFLGFALCMCQFSSAAAARADRYGRHGGHVADISIVNSLPANSSLMQVHCKSRTTDLGFHSLDSGEDYQWKAQEMKLHYCEAIWGRNMASWHAFQPRRDASHQMVFWMVKKDGFFLSWDKAIWVRKSTWDTE